MKTQNIQPGDYVVGVPNSVTDVYEGMIGQVDVVRDGGAVVQFWMAGEPGRTRIWINQDSIAKVNPSSLVMFMDYRRAE